MFALLTKYYGPTDTKGSRIKVTGTHHGYSHGVVSKFYGWDYSVECQHTEAAIQYLYQLNIKRAAEGLQSAEIMSKGALPDGTGYAFIIGYGKEEA